MDKDQCPVFGVESGVPIIGLGILILLFGIVPLLPGPTGGFPVFIAAILIGFGIFLVWVGLTQ